MSKNNTAEILRWSGLMGHRFVVIEPDNSPTNGALYGGWRCCSESNSLEHAIQDLKPGRLIYQKVGRRLTGGIIRERWVDVTPKAAAA